MNVRYQVFISSTYADLQEERKQVIQTVISANCIPAGMELFPAIDEEQFEFIKRVIDDCDYYLLIVAGRYGSLAPDGISYTEKEYDYAVTRGLKVIALIHDSPDDISLAKSEPSPELRERLRQFREKVKTGKLVKPWRTVDELPGLVALSLMSTINLFPATGWVRGDRIASEDLLEEVNELRKLNASLQKSLDTLAANADPPVEDMAGLEDEFTIGGENYRNGTRSGWQVTATWGEIFAVVAPYLVEFPNDTRVGTILRDAMFARAGRVGGTVTLDDQQFKTVSVQLRALGLVNMTYGTTTQGGSALFWALTPLGERTMLQLRVVRRSPSSDDVKS